MDAKDLRTEANLGECISNGSGNYTQRNTSTQTGDKNSTYLDIGSNSLCKVGVQAGRPCAVIEPDRAASFQHSTPNSFDKREQLQHWPLKDNAFQPTYFPQKTVSYPHPQRNISPRQTFQENMQRIMVPPSYNSKVPEDNNFALERSETTSKAVKAAEIPKYCDVPFTVNHLGSEQKHVNNSELSAPNITSPYVQGQGHGWRQSAISSHLQLPYGSPDFYQYNEYPSCAVPPNMPYVRAQRVPAEEPAYPEHYYRGRNIRFEPYPSTKERFPPPRYDYMSRYPSPYQTTPLPSYKYDFQKAPPTYPTHLQGSHVREPALENYQRNPKQQINFSVPYHGQAIATKCNAVPGNSAQSKFYPYPDYNMNPAPSQPQYDQRNKIFVDYKTVSPKAYPPPQNYYRNEYPGHMVQGQMVSNYSPNIHPLAYYRKDVIPPKNSEYLPPYKATAYYNPGRQYSPTASAISPSELNSNNQTNYPYRRPQEGFEYTPTGHNIRNPYPTHYPMYQNYDSRYGQLMHHSHTIHKIDSGVKSKIVDEAKKNIDVRQFLQSWSEGDDEVSENGNKNKEIILQTSGNFSKQCENLSSQDQLYVLGLVNVPTDELGKYEHIQKVSKLPDNIKGYTNIELLNQFEEAIESSNIQNTSTTEILNKHVTQKQELPGRPVSPFDVEAKISQSVIHKDVGCNFEIKPCSPGVVSVQVATAAQPLVAERVIEKVSNPVKHENVVLPKTENKPIKNNSGSVNKEQSVSCCDLNISKNQAKTESNHSYSVQDLESNSGVCLASLPRLDNDIELNFPEVNQQFINANKPETNGAQDTCGREIKVNGTSNDHLMEPDDLSLSKDYCKLINYRKSKGIEIENNVSVAPTRTDSVIKNMVSLVEHISAANNNETKSVDDSTIKQNMQGDDMNAIDLTVSENTFKAPEYKFNNELDPLDTNNQDAFHTDESKTDLPKSLISILTDEATDNAQNNQLVEDDDNGTSNLTTLATELKPDDIFDSIKEEASAITVTKIQFELNMEKNNDDNLPETTDSIKNFINDTADSYEYSELQMKTENSDLNIEVIPSKPATPTQHICDAFTGPTVEQAKLTDPSTASHFHNDSALMKDECNAILDEVKNETTNSNINIVGEESKNKINENTKESPDICVEKDEEKIFTSKRYWNKKLFSPIIQNLLTTVVKLCNHAADVSKQATFDENTDSCSSNVNNMSSTIEKQVTYEQNPPTTEMLIRDQYLVDNITSTPPLSTKYESDMNLSAIINCQTLLEEKTPENYSSDFNGTELTSSTPNLPEECEEPNINLDRDKESLEKHVNQIDHIFSNPSRRTLKRSMSESAITIGNTDISHVYESLSLNKPLLCLKKRKRKSEDGESHIVLDNQLSNLLHISRRNSVSTLSEDNVSFCIMINENCLVAEENVFEDGTLCIAKIEDNAENCAHESLENEEKSPKTTDDEYVPFRDPEVYVSCDEEQSEQNWVDDVACVETVISDETDNNDSYLLSPLDTIKKCNFEIENHIDEMPISIKKIMNDSLNYGPNMYLSESEIPEDTSVLINPQTEMNRNCLEELLSSTDSSLEDFDRNLLDTGVTFNIFKEDVSSLIEDMTKEHVRKKNYVDESTLNNCKTQSVNIASFFETDVEEENLHHTNDDEILEELSSTVIYKRSSSSPEVTSTTSDDKKSGILLKITNHNGARTSKINGADKNDEKKIRCKFSDSNDYSAPKTDVPPRPLITKAAQKYIPPLKETIGDLKVKLHLPKDSLIQLKQLKKSKGEVASTDISKIKRHSANHLRPGTPQKPKPKFEDVLKSIDDFQIKMSKEKLKKSKKGVPKVIIKKSENGSHYASRSSKDPFNPDLTGRKWQPWVFLDKNNFIDKMALKNRRKAIYCHRKKSYILFEKFRKYRSVNKCDTEFVISKPSDSISVCPLKYTIRLKRPT